jgi:glycosyltransferase involved in cell wall biosynthesis
VSSEAALRAVRVSVVMPVRDAAPFIRESIESVRAQTRADWELLVVDDGSRDASAAIARDVAQQDPRVRVLGGDGLESRGASWARNAALREARGEYIAFLDADDVWVPEKLAEQVPLLEARPDVGMLYGNTQYWFSWTGSGADRDFLPELGVSPDTVVPPPRLLERMLRDRAAVPCTCSVLVRKHVVEGVGGFEERFREVFTDQAFYAKVLLATSAYVASGCWDRYRQHPASSVNRAERAGRLRALQIDYLEWLRDYARSCPAADASLRRAIARALWMNRHIEVYLLYRRVHALAGRVRRWLVAAATRKGPTKSASHPPQTS